MSEKTKIHYGWPTVIVALLFMGFGYGIYSANLGIFIRPVSMDLGFMRGQFTLTGSISLVVSVLLMPYFGTLFHKYGFKKIAIIGTIITGLTILGQSISTQLWHFYLMAIIVGIVFNANGYMAVGILINKWFVDKKGLAIGLAFSGPGAISAFMIPLANYFVQLNGWRWTYRFLAFVSTFVLLFLILLFVKEKPEDKGLEPYRSKKATDGDSEKAAKMAAAQTSGLTRAEAFRTPHFWFMGLAIFGVALCLGPYIHTQAFLVDIGYSLAYASGVMAVYMVFYVLFSIIIGIMYDRFGSKKTSLFIGGSCVLFPVLALFAGNPAVPFVFAIVLSIATSGGAVTTSVLTANYFGRKDFARVFAISQMFYFLGVTIAFPGFGFIYDTTGSYTFGWYLMAGIGVLICIAMIGASRITKRVAYETG